MAIIELAKYYATAAHAATGQKRKYTNEPYIVHPTEVAELVLEYGGDSNMIAAAYLHDLVEDTAITVDDIEALFGWGVADLVYYVTDISKKEDGNRATRKAIDREHYAAASARAQTIKLADIVSNCRSIGKHDPNFAKVYFAEKRDLLEVMNKGNAALHELATELVKNTV